MLSQEAELSYGRASRADEDKPHPAPKMYTSNERRVSYAHIAALLSLRVTSLPPCDCPLYVAGRATCLNEQSTLGFSSLLTVKQLRTNSLPF
jgi:hypothetical protein